MGGLIAGGAYMVRGSAGTGKTMVGLHFLTDGIKRGEKALFITLSETEKRIRRNAASTGFDLAGIEVLDLTPDSQIFADMQGYDLFTAAEVDQEPMTRKIVEAIEHHEPQRIFLDSITQFRYLASDDFQFRMQVLSFLRFLLDQGSTVLFTSEATERAPDEDLQFLADGLINLALGPIEGRTLVVTKLRGSGFRPGQHSMSITDDGVHVFPKLIPADFRMAFETDKLPFGVAGLDELLVGGLERGTVTILTGPSGVGKTTLGVKFMVEAASRGEHAVVYTFHEEPEIILQRAESLKIPARTLVESGGMSLVKIEPLAFSPDEFAAMVRHEVEVKHARVIMIDSVAGYRLSLRGADLISHLHALTKYLQNMGVVVVLINELETVSGEFRATEVGASYLADNIVFLRYIELHQDEEVELHKGIGVLKKRLTNFDRRMREIAFHDDGIHVSAPLAGISSILGVLPKWNGKFSQKPVGI
jgi:circadian clock protein KaiC